MKYTIERVENGYMITGRHPSLDNDAVWVFEHAEDDDDAEALQHVLQELVEIWHPISKHNAKNVHVEIRPGSDYED